MTDNIVRVLNLTKVFLPRNNALDVLLRRISRSLSAVDNICFNVGRGEMLGLVGESGCGKTTTGKLVLNIIKPTSGSVEFNGVNISEFDDKQMKSYRRQMQMIYQDPYQSLPPSMRVRDIIAEPLRFHNLCARADEEKMVGAVLNAVKLIPPKNFIDKFPKELSGGQRQRVAFARAFVTKPLFLVVDEPVSMLDASIRTGLLNLMLELRKEYGYSAIFITHDFGIARYMCDRIAVMYLGRIVELGPTEEIIKRPKHPYTKALLSVVPVPDPSARKFQIAIKGAIPDATNPPPGCRFHPRCKYAKEICKSKEPELLSESEQRLVACHFAAEVAAQEAN